MPTPPTNEQIKITELAQSVGCDRSHISMILRGKRQPSFPLAKRISVELGVTLDELYDKLQVTV